MINHRNGKEKLYFINIKKIANPIFTIKATHPSLHHVWVTNEGLDVWRGTTRQVAGGFWFFYFLVPTQKWFKHYNKVEWIIVHEICMISKLGLKMCVCFASLELLCTKFVWFPNWVSKMCVASLELLHACKFSTMMI